MLLRYFNPIGAHPSGLIGDDQVVITNLMPLITKVAVGKLAKVKVFGNDYPTPDGTGVRDYIHIEDLALGHLAALNRLDRINGIIDANLGAGRGYGVFEVIKASEQTSGRKIPFNIVAGRFGDIASCYANPSLAHKLLGWKTQLDMNQMCEDAWHWQSVNPSGYS